jgi:replicative DNA helicase
MFYEPLNAQIYEVIKQFYEENKIIYQVTINEALSASSNATDLKLKLQEILFLNLSYFPHVYMDYMNIIYEKYYRRKIIEEFYPIFNNAYDDTIPIADLTSQITLALDKYAYLDSDSNKKSAKDAVSRTIELIEEEAKGEKTNLYPTGFDILDNLLYYSPGNITLVGGKGGSGKTRWLIALMLGLLKNNKDIAILWYNMEDSSEKIIRCMIGNFLKLDEKTLRSRKESLLTTHIVDIKEIQHKISEFDIKFNDFSDTIDNIYREFIKFVVLRKDKFCLLIIDNLMLLEDHNNKRNATDTDDYIARRISGLLKSSSRVSNVGTSIIPVHHFAKEQADKLNLKEGYRPREEHLKGSSRYKDVATQVILINRPDMYKDLIMEYRHIEKLISSLFITEITKNRDGDTGIIRWFSDLSTITFKEINKSETL